MESNFKIRQVNVTVIGNDDETVNAATALRNKKNEEKAWDDDRFSIVIKSGIFALIYSPEENVNLVVTIMPTYNDLMNRIKETMAKPLMMETTPFRIMLLMGLNEEDVVYAEGGEIDGATVIKLKNIYDEEFYCRISKSYARHFHLPVIRFVRKNKQRIGFAFTDQKKAEREFGPKVLSKDYQHNFEKERDNCFLPDYDYDDSK